MADGNVKSRKHDERFPSVSDDICFAMRYRLLERIDVFGDEEEMWDNV